MSATRWQHTLLRGGVYTSMATRWPHAHSCEDGCTVEHTNLAAPGKRVQVNLSKRGAEAEKARRARGDEGDADALSVFITSGGEAWALRVPPLPSF